MYHAAGRGVEARLQSDAHTGYDVGAAFVEFRGADVVVPRLRQPDGRCRKKQHACDDCYSVVIVFHMLSL